jgi:hypothetical protein
MPIWTGDYVRFLEKNYLEMTSEELSKRMSEKFGETFSKGSISWRLYSLGLLRHTVFTGEIEGEIWKFNEHFDVYVSDKGRVKRITTLKNDVFYSCHERSFVGGGGSRKRALSVSIKRNGEPKKYTLLSYLVVKTFKPESLTKNIKYEIEYIDNNWENCDINNLRVVNRFNKYSENNNGEKNAHHKLTEKDVEDVCKILSSNPTITHREILESIGYEDLLTAGAISNIQHGLTWKRSSVNYDFSNRYNFCLITLRKNFLKVLKDGRAATMTIEECALRLNISVDIAKKKLKM